MCDQKHFDEDFKDYETRVTRKQFGVLLGAGMSMMLPPVANAAAVTESDVTVTTPDGAADCYFVHPASGTAPGVLVWPDIFGLRPAFRQMGKRLAESGYSVLVVNPFYRTKKAPHRSERRRHADRRGAADGCDAQRNHEHDRCQGLHRLARPASVGREEPEDGHARLLHGRPDRLPHLRRVQSRGSRCLLPWRWTRARYSDQSASAGGKDEGSLSDRDRGE